MREESNRVIKNLQDNIDIERQQRQAELKAMQNNAALVEKQFAENTKIALQNIKNEGQQRIANAQGAVKQADLDAKATDSIVKSLLDFAPTLQGILNKQAEREVRNQTQQGLTADVQDISGEIEENRRAQEALLLGGLQLNENIKEDAILSGEPEVETLKGIVLIMARTAFRGRSLIIGLLSKLTKPLCKDVWLITKLSLQLQAVNSLKVLTPLPTESCTMRCIELR